MAEDLAALLAPASSILAKALSGANASLVRQLLGEAMLQDGSATPEQLFDALKKADASDRRQKIASAEASFLANSKAVQIELARVCEDPSNGSSHLLAASEINAANDRASARQRQQTTNDRTNAYLAYIVTVGFLLTILLVARFNLSGSANPALQTLLGILGTGWASMMAFFFGSSVGSREKTAILGEANTPPKTTKVGTDANRGENE